MKRERAAAVEDDEVMQTENGEGGKVEKEEEIISPPAKKMKKKKAKKVEEWKFLEKVFLLFNLNCCFFYFEFMKTFVNFWMLKKLNFLKNKLIFEVIFIKVFKYSSGQNYKDLIKKIKKLRNFLLAKYENKVSWRSKPPKYLKNLYFT